MEELGEREEEEEEEQVDQEQEWCLREERQRHLLKAASVLPPLPAPFRRRSESSRQATAKAVVSTAVLPNR